MAVQNIIYYVFLTLLIHTIIRNVDSADPTDISRLRATILQNYDKYARPVSNHLNATDVYISFELMGFEFDEFRGALTLHLFLYMGWYDEHAAWEPMDYGNLSEITFAAEELWKPDVSVTNNLKGDVEFYNDVPITVRPSGWVWWAPPTKFQVGCQTDLEKWPYDQQFCHVHLQCWTQRGDEIRLKLSSTYDSEYIIYGGDWGNFTENREWKVLSSLAWWGYIEDIYCCPKMPLSYLQLEVEIERKSSAHTAAVSVVGLGIAITVLISFWLDPFAQERIPLTLMVILINALYLQYMHKTIPNNGETVPLVVCFFRDSLIMATFSLGWIVLMRHMAKTRRNSPVPLPDIVETVLNSFVGTILCLNPRPQSKGQRKPGENTEEDEDISELVEETDNAHKEDWEWLARLCDRILFILYLITFVVFYSAFL